MSSQQKKIIPKLKKKLQGFLTDESGKIAKEDVLKMSMIAMGIAGMIPMDDTLAAHANSHANSGPLHCSSTPTAGGHASWNPHANSAFSAHVSGGGYKHGSGDPGHANVACIWDAGPAYSGTLTHIVNGHVNLANNVQSLGHWQNSQDASHGSHGSHGSHCNCSRNW